MSYKDWDLSALEEMWDRRARAVQEAIRKIDTAGMTRPRRDPAERKFLEERGRLGPFIETDVPFAYPRRRRPDPAPDSGNAGKDPSEWSSQSSGSDSRHGTDPPHRSL